MRRLCVFCGSSTGRRAIHADAARALGMSLARRGLGLVYGGGSIGLMGVVADAVLAGGGSVIGVIPEGLYSAEIAHAGLTELHVVASMHDRKAMMMSLADGFVALPGGLGTFEELLEVLTWLQLGIHRKPVALLDVDDYWRGLRRLLDDAVAEGFLDEARAAQLLVESDVDILLDRMRDWTPPALPRIWLTPSEACRVSGCDSGLLSIRSGVRSTRGAQVANTIRPRAVAGAPFTSRREAASAVRQSSPFPLPGASTSSTVTVAGCRRRRAAGAPCAASRSGGAVTPWRRTSIVSPAL